MSEYTTGRVKPTQSQPRMGRLDDLPEVLTYAQMKAQAQGPFAFKSAVPPTTQGVTPPMTPGGPIAAARHFPTPSPRNVKE
jgi:hypothetical protein